MTNPTHAKAIIRELGLEGANTTNTPDVAEGPPEHSPELDPKKAFTSRRCTGTGVYYAQDRSDYQRAVGMLGGDLNTPTESSWKRLLRCCSG